MNQERLLQDVLQDFDARSEPYSENEVASRLRNVRNQVEQAGEAPSEALIAEALAFSFQASPEGQSTWKTYLGPKFVGRTESGEPFESPSIQDVTVEILRYWENRAKVARHPVLCARYADLVWDFSRAVTGKGARVEMARAVIDAAAELALQEAWKRDSLTTNRLSRALSLAVSINDAKRIETIKQAIILLESHFERHGSSNELGFAFDELVDHSQVRLTDEEENRIVGNLKRKLDELADPRAIEAFDPFLAKSFVIKLAQHYRRLENRERMRDVLSLYSNALQRKAATVAPMTASSWLRELHDLFIHFEMKDAANALHPAMAQANRSSMGDMVTVSTKVELSYEEEEESLARMLEGTCHESLRQIALCFVEDPQEAAAELAESAQSTPLLMAIRSVTVDGEGRPLAELGPFAEDPEGHVLRRMSQEIQIVAPFLRRVLEAVFTRFNISEDQMVQYLQESPVFKPERAGILKAGIRAYFHGDTVAAIHLLVPEIEAAVRHLAEMVGAPIFRSGKRGGLDLRSLHDLLSTAEVKAVLGDTIATYLQCLLTDQRGLNIRNDVCHGFVIDSQCGYVLADRLLHVMLVLALICKKTEGAKPCPE